LTSADTRSAVWSTEQTTDDRFVQARNIKVITKIMVMETDKCHESLNLGAGHETKPVSNDKSLFKFVI
jgi:hypothetical protein